MIIGYDATTATFEEDKAPHPHEVHRFEDEGGVTFELVDKFEQVQGD